MATPEDYSERKAILAGWPVTIVSYRLNAMYHTTIEHHDPGAWIVNASGPTQQAAETRALKDAQVLLDKIRQTKPPTGCTSVPGS